MYSAEVSTGSSQVCPQPWQFHSYATGRQSEEFLLVSSGRLVLLFAGMPLSVGDLVAGKAADDFLSSINDAAVLGTIAQGKSNVIRPFIGLVVPLRALVSRSRSGTRNQALIDGNAGYRVAIIAAGQYEGLLPAEINNRDEVRLAVGRKFLLRCDLQCASTADLHNIRKIRRILDGSEIRIPFTGGSDSK